MASNLYKSYGQKGGRFKDSDPGYGALTELRRQNETQIRAHQRNANAIESQQKEWLSRKEKSQNAELSVREDVRNFERKADDLKIQNIRIASKQILARGKDEAAHHIKVGKLLSSISESAGAIGATVAEKWEEAGEIREKHKTLNEQLDDPDNKGIAETVKKGIEEKEKDDDKDIGSIADTRQRPDVDQEVTGLPSQASIMWGLMGFRGKNDKFKSNIFLAKQNVDTAFEEWKANNGGLDFTDKESYRQGYNQFAEEYLRKVGAWDSYHPHAIELKEAMLAKAAGQEHKIMKGRNEAINKERVETKLNALSADRSPENLARTFTELLTIGDPESGVGYTPAAARGLIANHYAHPAISNPQQWEEFLSSPAMRIDKNGKMVPHQSGGSWRSAYPKEASAWEQKRTQWSNQDKANTTRRSEQKDKAALATVTAGMFAKEGDDNYEGSLAQARDKQLAGEDGALEKKFDALKIEHAGNPTALEFIQKAEWLATQTVDNATTEQWAEKLHREGRTEELLDWILGAGTPADQKKLADKYMPGITKLQQSAISFTDLQKSLDKKSLALLKIDDVSKFGDNYPLDLKLFKAEASKRWFEHFNSLDLPPAQAVQQTNQWFEDQIKNNKDNEGHWTHVTSSADSDLPGGRAYFTNFIGLKGNYTPKTTDKIKEDHNLNPDLYKQSLQHDIRTLIPVIDDLKSGNSVRIPQNVKDAANALNVPLRDYLWNQIQVATGGLHTNVKGTKDDKSWAEMGIGPRELVLSMNPAGLNWSKAVQYAKNLRQLKGLYAHAYKVNNGAKPKDLTRKEVADKVLVNFKPPYAPIAYPVATGQSLNQVITFAKEQGMGEIKPEDFLPAPDNNEISVLNGKDLVHARPGSVLWDAMVTAKNSKGKMIFKPCFVQDPKSIGAYSRPTCFRRN